jgi:integrase
MTKNDSSRHVPLSSRAVDILRSLPRSIDGRVFPISHWSVAKVFEAACKRAGTKDMRFHDLRHTTTSRTSFESSRRTESEGADRSPPFVQFKHRPKKIVELTIRQIRESRQQELDKLIESEESGPDDEIRILGLRLMINDVLPELERRIKKSY